MVCGYGIPPLSIRQILSQRHFPRVVYCVIPIPDSPGMALYNRTHLPTNSLTAISQSLRQQSLEECQQSLEE
jgi:hypothetical protein